MSCNTIINLATSTEASQFKFENNFEVVGESLGSGGFGTVYKVKKRNTVGDQRHYALKIIDVSKIKHFDNYKSEVNALSKLNHTNIVSYYDAWTEDFKIPKSEYEEIKYSEDEIFSVVLSLSSSNLANPIVKFQKHASTSTNSDELSDEEVTEEGTTMVIKKFLFIQMELCECNLRDIIKLNLHLDNTKINQYFLEMCSGLQHIHENDIIHRDLKPENIFFSGGKIKIGDFGLSKLIKHEKETLSSNYYSMPKGGLRHRNQQQSNSLLSEQTGCIGSALYMAPEVKSDSKQYNQKVDMYSLGLIYFEMCYKEIQTECEKIEVFELLKTAFSFPDDFNCKVKHRCKIIKSLLEENSKKRWDINYLIKFLNDNKPVNPKEFSGMITNLKYDKSRLLKKEYGKNLMKLNESAYSQAKFIKVATEVFQLHGAQLLHLPIFIPKPKNNSGLNSLNICGENITVLSISNDSRPVFAEHVKLNKIYDFRRYSICKVYQENTSDNNLPIEIQECSFDIISPSKDYSFADAETLYTAYQINERLLKTKNENIYIKYNNLIITKKIIANFIPDDKEMQLMCLKVLEETVNETKEKLKTRLYGIGLKQSSINQILHFYDFDTTRFKYKNRYCSKFKILLDEFGIPNAKYTPLLVTNLSQYSSFVFQMVYKSDESSPPFEMATGGRYDHAVNNKTKFRRSAVGMSFNVDVMSTILTMDESEDDDSTDIAIIGKEKDCIPIMKILWDNNVSCKVIPQICSGFKMPKMYLTHFLGTNVHIFNGESFGVMDYTSKSFVTDLKSFIRK